MALRSIAPHNASDHSTHLVETPPMLLRRFPPVLLLCAGALLAGSLHGDADAPTLRFTERLIADGYGYAFGVAAVDLDGDGDRDLTSCDTVGNAMYWFENDGKGEFQRHVIQKDEGGWFERHALGDLDLDGRPDLVVVKNQAGQLVWFRNSGAPKDGKPWERHVIAASFPKAYDVALADLDDDGDLDVAASSWVANVFAWFENPGKDAVLKGEDWKRHDVDEKIGETRTIRAADINGDGRLDLVGTARVENLTAWYENPGKDASAWTRHVIDDKSPQPMHGHPVDLDGDGDFDLVLALGMLAAKDQPETNQIAWYENVGTPGKGESWKRHVIGPLEGAFEAAAADLDGDGDADVVATAWGGVGRVVWFENLGDPRGQWTRHVLKEKWPRANQAIVVDLDGDRRPDIVATAERGANELRWWRNEGKK